MPPRKVQPSSPEPEAGPSNVAESKEAYEIRIHAQLPENVDKAARNYLDAANWNWHHCLTLPAATLRAIRQMNYSWIRYVTGIVVGTHGHLHHDRNDDSQVNYAAEPTKTTMDLYFHTSESDKRRMFPLDPHILDPKHKSGISDANESRKARFAEGLQKREKNQCVFSEYSKLCEGAHLIPHSKGDQYIKTFTEERDYEQNPANIVPNIDNIRNGLFINKNAHEGLGTVLGFLVTPNFAMDANPVAGTRKNDLTFTMHLLDPTQEEYLLGIGFNSKARVPKSKPTWPPVTLFEAIYASAVVHQFGVRSGGWKGALGKWDRVFYKD